MFYLIPTLLLAGVANAQLTTTFIYLRDHFGTDKIGFYGSVVNVTGSQTTLALEIDNGTDPDVPNGAGTNTFIVGSTMFAYTRRLGGMSTYQANYIDEEDIVLRCNVPATPSDAAPSCTRSLGRSIARGFQCQTTASAWTTYRTDVYTYSGRLSYSAGVETIVRTAIFGPNTRGVPTWCDDRQFTPSSGFEYTLPVKRADIATYQVVITAGQEKLTATQGASASGSGATPTGGAAGPGSSAAAMPLKTAAPMMVGLGAAVAVFL